MRRTCILLGLLALSLSFTSCQSGRTDSLTVELAEAEGAYPFPQMTTSTNRYDTTRTDMWFKTAQTVAGIPDSLESAAVYFDNMQVYQLVYQGFQAGLVDSSDYAYWTNSPNFDSAKVTTEFVDQQIHFLLGRDLAGRYVLMFDTNNNERFDDEEAHVLPAEKPVGDYTLVNDMLPEAYVQYEAFDGNETVTLMERLIVNPYIELPPSMQGRTTMYGSRSHRRGVLNYNGKQYAWWVASPMPGVFDEENVLVWVEAVEGVEAMPERPAIQELLLQKAMADKNNAFSMTEGDVYPPIEQAYEIGDVIILGEDAFRIDSVTGWGEELILKSTDFTGVGLRTGLKAPDFEAIAMDSTTLRLSDYQGKYVFLDFWGTWCAPCLDELPYLREAYEAYDRDTFDIIGIANDNAATLRYFVEEEGIPWVQIQQQPWGDNPREILDLYRIQGYPTTFLLDPEGIIVARDNALSGGRLAVTLQEHIGR